MQKLSQVTGEQPDSTSPQNNGGETKSRASPLHILVMGPQGCGKSSFINLATSRSGCVTSATSTLCTKCIRFSKASRRIDGNEFKFIDTPGFGNETIEDTKIFKLLVEFFAPNPRGDRQNGSDQPRSRKITGLLYIHSEDEPFRNRTSQKTVEMLVKILGEQFLDRLTVLFQLQNKPEDDLSGFMPPEGSPLRPLYRCGIKPRTISYKQDTQSVEQILKPYTELFPRLVSLPALDNFFQRDSDSWERNDIFRYLQELLDDSGPATITYQPHSQSSFQEHAHGNGSGDQRNMLVQEEGDVEDHESTRNIGPEDFPKHERHEELVQQIELNCKSLCEIIRTRGEEISQLKLSNDSSLKELEASKNKLTQEKDAEIEALQKLLAQKEEEMKNHQFTFDIERQNFRNERVREKFNDEVALKHLRNTIEDQEAEIASLKSGKGSELARLEALKNEEMEKLSSTKDSEIVQLQTLLVQKEEEIRDLQSSHSVRLDNIQKFAHEIELNFKNLWGTIGDQGRISELGSKNSTAKESNMLHIAETSQPTSKKGSKIKRLQDQVLAKNDEISKLGLEKDSEIRALQDALHAKDEELTKLRTENAYKIRGRMSAAHSKEREKTELKNKANDTSTQPQNNQGGEIHHLNAKATDNQTNPKYGLPRYDMQVQEKTEQGDITTALSDINRLIEDFGAVLIEDVKDYIEQSPPERTLQPQDLLGLFGQVEADTASKVKQDAYVLFEYAVQSTICNHLYTHLFEPFHPSLTNDEKRNTFIMQMYEQITYQEPQSVAGRWRKDAFNSISRDPSLGSQDQPDNHRMHQLITGSLSTLLREILGNQPHELLKKHDRTLVKVIAKAEELNQLLKGGVSILGDFQPIVFPFGETFRPDYMSEIMDNEKAKNPEKILATVGLGLVKIHALGGGRKPEETVMRKAVVFAQPKQSRAG
ncbi:unnamed protein product [Rhizoctonia solani]|uniref:G domain-containing protein n=1 Tax=Rhizoctonia solani TaxID=456999 RepID=A0A8H3BWF1_9AGAM|nr:unnamed protein product [Rhizoctonia solani]